AGPAGAEGEGERVAGSRTNCLGYCEHAPAALVRRSGDPCQEQTVAPAGAADLLEALEGKPFSLSPPPRIPKFGSPDLRLLRRIGRVDPASLEDYRAQGGYQALPRALQLGSEALIRELRLSRLMGRGGAAFPASRKWEAVAKGDAPRYLVCNA